MRFMLMNKSNPDTEAGIRPSAELIAGVGGMIAEMSRAGVFRDAAGLRASSLGARLVFAAGKRTVTPGPFVGANELPSALCIMRVRSLEEAVEWASRLGEALGEAEIDVRPVTEPRDLGFGEKPKDDPTIRFMAALKADGRSERGEPLAPGGRAAVAYAIEEMKRAGVYLSAEALQPGARSKRLLAGGRPPKVIDGPFTESKELIAGFVTLEVPSIVEATVWATRYAATLGDAELDVRPLYEPKDLG